MGFGNFFKFMMRWSIFSSMYGLDGKDGGGIGPIEGYLFNKQLKRFIGFLPGFPDRDDYDDDDDNTPCGYSQYNDDDD